MNDELPFADLKIGQRAIRKDFPVPIYSRIQHDPVAEGMRVGGAASADHRFQEAGG